MTEAATQSLTPVEPSFEPLQGMRSLRVLARLLDYPTQELQDASGELIEILNAERRLGAALKSSLMEWCQRLQEGDLLELQAEYVAMFDKGRATSLLLFEHVHGESRDRGQAMVT
jgi:nitrate reductase molybdenum cofactor assembly chaperone NarJ/NarW